MTTNVIVLCFYNLPLALGKYFYLWNTVLLWDTLWMDFPVREKLHLERPFKNLSNSENLQFT